MPWARPMVGKWVQLGLESILKTEANAFAARQRGLDSKERVERFQGLKRGVKESQAASTRGPNLPLEKTVGFSVPSLGSD